MFDKFNKWLVGISSLALLSLPVNNTFSSEKEIRASMPLLNAKTNFSSETATRTIIEIQEGKDLSTTKKIEEITIPREFGDEKTISKNIHIYHLSGPGLFEEVELKKEYELIRENGYKEKTLEIYDRSGVGDKLLEKIVTKEWPRGFLEEGIVKEVLTETALSDEVYSSKVKRKLNYYFEFEDYKEFKEEIYFLPENFFSEVIIERKIDRRYLNGDTKMMLEKYEIGEEDSFLKERITHNRYNVNEGLFDEKIVELRNKKSDNLSVKIIIEKLEGDFLIHEVSEIKEGVETIIKRTTATKSQYLY